MALVSLTLILSAVWTESRDTRKRDEAMDRAMTPLLADNFAEVYDLEGKNGLEELLEHGKGSFPWEPYLFSQDGNEVLNRSVSPQAVQAMKLALASKKTEVVHASDARWVGQYVEATSHRPYVLVLEINRRASDPGFVAPSHVQVVRLVIALLIVGLICFWITRSITSPLFQLRSTANELASGNLSARVKGAALLRKDELASLGKAFNHMADQIESLMSSQRRLIADISHELRSPLARLSVALGLARRNADPTTDAALNRIERETHRLNELISGLLNLARLESGTEKLDQEVVDLQALVLDVVEDANFEASSRNRSVRVLTSYPCRRKGSSQLLCSAIENSVRNAVNYTPEGTEVEVSLLPADRGSSALIHIRDHGSGVPESALKTIFEPFFRVDEARDRLSGGAGLGLSITDRVIRAHGGSVRAHNHADGGLVLELTLPLV